jgi:hypothetical protein
MKQLIINIILILFSSNRLYAQEVDNVDFGVIGGINFSSFTEKHKEPLVGGEFGVFGNYYFWDDLGAGLDLMYSRKGGIMRGIIPAPPEFNQSMDQNSFDFYIRNNYFELLFELKYRFRLDDKLFLIPLAGYSYSIPLWSQESSEKKNYVPIDLFQEIDYTGKYSQDMVEINSISSLIIGVEAEINRFLVTAHYSLALNNIGGAADVSDLNYKINSFSILIGYSFL